ncbi:armadillo repeat-containing protein 8-like isoform X2 [Arctopsyche grandis]|uniref:armadillo repeat-containing protein 8-like isoform X2 n=1 Tax=Arctopsyche grandis TaxID=121162 RepID=UPI00406D9EC1
MLRRKRERPVSLWAGGREPVIARSVSASQRRERTGEERRGKSAAATGVEPRKGAEAEAEAVQCSAVPCRAPSMECECSRAFVDELYAGEWCRVSAALVSVKNAVIGSNRQKASLIQQGVVPRLLQLLQLPDSAPQHLRLDAAITIGSLAKGTAENVASLVDLGVVGVLVETLRPNTDPRLTEACLCALRSIFMHPPAPSSIIHRDPQLLSQLLSVAQNGTLVGKSCVARLLSVWCSGKSEQEALAEAGACNAAAALLAAASPPSPLTLPTLDWLAAMCFENPAVSQLAVEAQYGGKIIPELLVVLLCRDKPLAVAMGAARCITFMHRAGALLPDDNRVVFGALPCLARLCTKDMPDDIRATAAETLAYLAEVDTSLQRLAAISNHLISALADLLSCHSAASKQGAFKCFASLGANDEDIRKKIIEINGLMVQVVDGMANSEPEVRLAAVRCLHSLSRSVQQLRTTFQDHSVWRPLMSLLNESPGAELLTVGSSTLCNLLLEFSPAKEPMLDQGAVEMLCGLTRRPEPALRLNGIWALMNMAFQAEQRVKTRILSCLGTEQMFRLLADSDTRIIMKTLGLLRNLLSTRQHIDAIMSDYASQVMQAVIFVLEGGYPAEVKEQALCILGNIGDGERAKDHIMANEDVLRKLVDYLVHPESKLQEAALFAIGNLVWRGEVGATERQARLAELGALRLLRQLLPTTDTAFLEKVKTALSQFSDYE